MSAPVLADANVAGIVWRLPWAGVVVPPPLFILSISVKVVTEYERGGCSSGFGRYQERRQRGPGIITRIPGVDRVGEGEPPGRGSSTSRRSRVITADNVTVPGPMPWPTSRSSNPVKAIIGVDSLSICQPAAVAMTSLRSIIGRHSHGRPPGPPRAGQRRASERSSRASTSGWGVEVRQVQVRGHHPSPRSCCGLLARSGRGRAGRRRAKVIARHG